MRRAHIFVYFILYLPTYDLYIQLNIVRALRALNYYGNLNYTPDVICSHIP